MGPMRKIIPLLFVILALASVVLGRTAGWSSWLDAPEVEPWVRSGSLIVYPLSGPARSLPRMRSLDSALMQGDLNIREVSEQGSVNRLVVENTGERAVFIMAGEVLSGARQDRILKHDLVVPADSGEIVVEAFCVEKGRWSYTGDKRKFESRGTLSNARVRQAAISPAGQQAVWDSVDESCKGAGVSAPTQALNALYNDGRVRTRVDRIVDKLRDLPDEYPYMNGVVVQVGNRIVALDVFPDRRVLVSLWPKLVRSYALEAVLNDQEANPISRGQLRDYLADVAEGSWRRSSTPGDGTLYTLHESGRDGQALILPEGLLHLQVLGSERIKTYHRPTPSPSPWPPAIDLVKPIKPRKL